MKKIISILLIAVMLVCFASCEKPVADVAERYGYDLENYLTLPDYIGIPIESFSDEVTDAEIEQQIFMYRLEYAEATETVERAAGLYDKVNIDYAGYMDGEQFSGGTAKGQELVLGSGSFIAGFEDGILGAMPGDTVTLELHFPDPYQNNLSLSGKPVTFVVTVNKIYSLEIPEYTDDFVKEHYKYDTTSDFEAALRSAVQSTKTNSKTNNDMNAALDFLIGGTEVKKYPQKEYDELYDSWIDYYTYYAKQKDMELDEYVTTELKYASADDFRDELAENTKSEMKEEMALYAVARRENITVTDEEYTARALEVAKQYGLSTVEEIEQYIDPADIRDNVLFSKVLAFIVEKANVTVADK